MFDRSFRLLLLTPLLLALFAAPAMADEPGTIPDWQRTDDAPVVVPDWQKPNTDFVWIKIILGQTDDDGVFHPHESVATPSCRDEKRVEARGETVAPGVYVEGLKPKPAGSSKIRTIDERNEYRRRAYCRDIFVVTINGEAVEMPASSSYARETRFGIPKTETEVRIQMPVELLLREHALISTRGDVGPLEMPAFTLTPEIVIPMDRFPEASDRVVEIKVVYTFKKATREDAAAEARARSDAAYREYTAAAAEAAGDTRTPPGNSP